MRMKVNDMDKYELTGRYKELMMIAMNPTTRGIPKDLLDEIMDPPTDNDGYVHKYYLTDEIKSLIEVLTSDTRSHKD